MSSVVLTVTAGPANVRKLLVIKKLLPALAGDDEFVAMFMNEARIAARLNHPNVLATFEVGSSSDGPFIVMEYLEGQSLSSILRRLGHAKFPLAYQVCVLRGILAGLEYAHNLTDFDGRALELVHRDVSPPNAVVCYDGQIKLVDFGIAKVAGHLGDTRPGTFKGKVGYAAPEHLLGEPLDRRADVFSVGVMLWEALAGRRMARDLSDGEVMRRRIKGKVPDVLAHNPSAPFELVGICRRALAFSPDTRYPSAAAMLADLDKFVETQQGMRVDERAMGRFVATHFEEERTQIRGLIEAQLSLLPSFSLDSDIDELLVDVGQRASAEVDSFAVLSGSTIDLATRAAASAESADTKTTKRDERSPPSNDLGRTVFVRSPREPPESLRRSQSQSSAPVQISVRPRPPRTVRSGAPSRHPWAFIGGATTVALLLVAAFVRVKKPAAQAAFQPGPSLEVQATSSPPHAPSRVLSPRDTPVQAAEPVRSPAEPPNHVALPRSAAPPSTKSAGAPARQAAAPRPRSPGPTKNTRPETAPPSDNVYDVELRDARRPARTIEEINPY